MEGGEDGEGWNGGLNFFIFVSKGVVMYSNMAKNPVRWIYVKVKAVTNILTRVTIGKKCSCLLSSSLL